MSEAEELAKARLWVSNQRAIRLGRTRAARALQAPPGPAETIRAGFAPVVLASRERGAAGGEDRERVPIMGGEPLLVTLGQPGPQGVPGQSGVMTLIHTQSSPLAIWVIAHNLGHYPDVNVFTPGGVQVETPEVINLTVNNLELHFSTPFAGTAHLT